MCWYPLNLLCITALAKGLSIWMIRLFFPLYPLISLIFKMHSSTICLGKSSIFRSFSLGHHLTNASANKSNKLLTLCLTVKVSILNLGSLLSCPYQYISSDLVLNSFNTYLTPLKCPHIYSQHLSFNELTNSLDIASIVYALLATI